MRVSLLRHAHVQVATLHERLPHGLEGEGAPNERGWGGGGAGGGQRGFPRP